MSAGGNYGKSRGIRAKAKNEFPIYYWLGNIVIRLRPGSAASAVADLKAVWERIMPAVPCEYAFLDEDFSRMYWREEQMGRLLEFFTALAVLIASLGLFGLSSFIAEQRTKEIGIRKILGASGPNIIFALSREFAQTVLLACVLAWPTAYVLARGWLNGFAYRTTLGLPLFLLAGLAAVGIAVASVSYQSAKTARTDPVKARNMSDESSGQLGQGAGMRNRKIVVLVCCLSAFHIAATMSQEKQFPVLKGPYLGQKLPGMSPEIFAPGIISTCLEHSSAIFSQNGNEIFFCRYEKGYKNPRMYCMREENGVWGKPRKVFSGEDFSELTPFLSPDGNTLYFTSTSRGDHSIKTSRDPTSEFWVSLRNDNNAWSQPEWMNIRVSHGIQKDGISVTNDKTIYFWALYKENGKNQADLFKCRYENGTYGTPEKLHEPINSSYVEVFSFVAPDNSYMIVSSFKPGGYGMCDLYVTFKKKDGSWTIPKNMGDRVNSSAKEAFPFVSRDGKYLFFNSSRASSINSKPIPEGAGNIFWVSANIIDELRTKE